MVSLSRLRRHTVNDTIKLIDCTRVSLNSNSRYHRKIGKTESYQTCLDTFVRCADDSKGITVHRQRAILDNLFNLKDPVLRAPTTSK
jgi:hypothetical protein